MKIELTLSDLETITEALAHLEAYQFPLFRRQSQKQKAKLRHIAALYLKLSPPKRKV